MCSNISNSLQPMDSSLLAHLSMEFSRQEYWSSLPFPTPGDLPDPGIETASLVSPELAGRFLATRGHLGRFVYFDSKNSIYW